MAATDVDNAAAAAALGKKLFDACEAGDLEQVKALIEDGAPIESEQEDKKKRRPLHAAARRGRLDVVKFLLEAGAEVDSVDMVGFTPLAMCLKDAHDCRDDVVDVLLKAGASPKREIKNGWTPLHLALRHASLYAVERCIESGGDLRALAENYSSLHLAVHNQDPEKLDIIQALVFKYGLPSDIKRGEESPMDTAKRMNEREAAFIMHYKTTERFYLPDLLNTWERYSKGATQDISDMLAQMRQQREVTEARNDAIIRDLEQRLRDARAKKAQELEELESRTRDETARLRNAYNRTVFVQTMLRKDYEAWEKKLRTPEVLDCADVALLLRELSIQLDLEKFVEHGITGIVLLNITPKDYEDFGVKIIGDKLHLSRAIARLKAKKPLTHMLLSRRTEANSTLEKDDLPRYVRDWTTDHLVSFINSNIDKVADIRATVPTIINSIRDLNLDGDDILEVAESLHDSDFSHVGNEIRAAINLHNRASFNKVALLVESSEFAIKPLDTPYATEIPVLGGSANTTEIGGVRRIVIDTVRRNAKFREWESSRQLPEFSGVVPTMLVCPLTGFIFDEPVLCSDGHVYEKAAIQAWLEFSATSPITGQPMSAKDSMESSAFTVLGRDNFLASHPAEARLDA